MFETYTEVKCDHCHKIFNIMEKDYELEKENLCSDCLEEQNCGDDPISDWDIFSEELIRGI